MNVADLLNAPTEITDADGKVWSLSEPTIMMQATFQRWLEQRARESAGRATDVPDEDRRNLLLDVTAAIAAGDYDWSGPICLKALQTPTGLAKITALILADQGCNETIARKLLGERRNEIISVITRTDFDPKDVASLIGRLGLLREQLLASLSKSSPTHPTDSSSTTSTD